MYCYNKVFEKNFSKDFDGTYWNLNQKSYCKMKSERSQVE